VDYVAAYNEISTSAVKGNFGRDVFKEAQDDEERYWKQEDQGRGKN
jgi:hypothetical protein